MPNLFGFSRREESSGTDEQPESPVELTVPDEEPEPESVPDVGPDVGPELNPWAPADVRAALLARRQTDVTVTGQINGEVKSYQMARIIWQTGPLSIERNGMLLDEINALLIERVQFLDSIVHDPINADIVQLYRDINALIGKRQSKRAAAGVQGTALPVPGDEN